MALWSIGCYGKNLKFKEITYFSVSRTRAISGLTLIDDALHYTAPRNPHLYSATINPKAPYPDLVIRGGKEPDFSADRWPFAKNGQKSEGTALARYPGRPESALLLDGRRMQLRFIDLAKKSQFARADVIIDHIRPAPDSRGEAPAAEAARVRGRFVKAVLGLMKRKATVITGMTYFGQAGSAYRYLATTAAPGFPLVTLSCRKHYCKIDTTCHLPRSITSGLVGVGYQPKAKLLVVADAKAVYKLRMRSCYDTKLLSKRLPPRQLRPLTALAIDAQQRLWLGTGGLDDYHAANIYAWDKTAWLRP